MKRCIRPDYEQQWLFPPTLEDLLPADHPARFVREFLRVLDLPALGFPLPPPGPGQPPWAPEVLLAVWLYGYLCRLYSTRKLEDACRNQIGFLWLTGLRAPDHSTLWAFFATHNAALVQLFAQIVKVAVQCGQVGLALHAVDGTKLAGACSRHTAWHRETLEEQLTQAAQAAAEAAAAEIAAAYATEPPAPRLTGALADATQRVETIQAALAALEAAQADHVSRTDPDARMLKLADGGCRLGYNAQVVAESHQGLIVAADVVPAATDAHQLTAMVAQVEETVGTVAEETAADGGYLSGEELAAAADAGYPVLVHLGETAAETGTGTYHKAQFLYDAARDAYQCPRGVWLAYETDKLQRDRGYTMRVYVCRCRDCPVKGQCTKEGRRRIMRTPYEEALAAQRTKQAVAENRQLLHWRGAVVERVFGHIKQHQGFRRFTVWGLVAVRAQWALVCSAMNVQTLYRAWQRGHFSLPVA